MTPGRHPHHDTREVNSSDAVQDEEEGGVCEGAEASNEAQGSQQHQDVHICEVGVPGRGLMLAHTGDDGDVLGGICGVQQTQAAACIQVCSMSRLTTGELAASTGVLSSHVVFQ